MSNFSRSTPLTVPMETTEQPARLMLWLSSGLALACYALVLVGSVTPFDLANLRGGLEATLLVAVTLSTLAAMARELPVQNVIMAAVIVALLGGGLHAIGAYTSMPFGPFTYLDNIGPCAGTRFRKILAWPMPLLWVVLIFNSRGVARLILRPWRKLKNYGLWLITLTVVLTVVLDLLFEPFASTGRRYWIWDQTKLPFNWQGVPLTNFLSWAIATILILAFVTPAVIKKRSSGSKSRPYYHALTVWGLAAVLFTGSAFIGHLWLVGGFGVIALITVTAAAVHGARW